MESDDSPTSKNGDDSNSNGFENAQTSPQIHPEKTANVKKDCADDVELDKSAS